MAKFERILNLFPGIYEATDQTKLLREVVSFLARPLEDADTELFRIQRAHRLKVAEHADDIIHLAGALNLNAFHFEDILDDNTIDYSQKLDLMRERVQRIARIHLNGLGTPWAVMESAAIFLNANIVPENSGDPLIKHIDKGSSSHKAVIEFTHLPGKPSDRIYLHENPSHHRKVEAEEKWPMNFWAIKNGNAESSPTKFVIQGIEDRTVLPGIFCLETQEEIVFNGIVPDGKTLVIDENNGAMLDSQPVDEWLIYFKGGLFDFSKSNASTFADEHVVSTNPCDGDLEKITSRAFKNKAPVPKVPAGRSKWYFKVEEGVFDGSDFDYSVYATNHKPIGIIDEDSEFDECVFDFPASGVAGMAWNEQIACCFKLLLPNHVPPHHENSTDLEDNTTDDNVNSSQSANYVSRVGNILPCFKAAGIQAFVDKAKDTWILGESILRNSTVAKGEGVEFHSTTLQNQKTDIFVPLDTTS